jgi:hypothetical protein
MTGGLMQLVATGSQDIYLTGNPQITYFKAIYRRYTNFAIETIENSVSGVLNFGNKLVCKVNRSGDLISKCYIKITIGEVDPNNSKFAWVKRLGHAILKEIDIYIGGRLIDKQHGIWLDIWYELAREGDHETAYNKLIGNTNDLTTYDKNIKKETVLYIPLKFWFCRFIGLSIPLIALQYHEININILLEKIERLFISDCNFNPDQLSIKDVSMLINYVYLDTEERRRFSIVGHEYLIEQVQHNGTDKLLFETKQYVLDYNHPTKEIIWANLNGNYIIGNEFIYYSNEDEWDLNAASKEIITTSISLGIDPTNITGGKWTIVGSSLYKTIGFLNVRNNNLNDVYINSDSIKIGTYGITNKIKADVIINEDSSYTIENIETNFTIRELSIPLKFMIDTRYNVCNPKVNQFGNYGLLIDGTINPIIEGLIELNGHERFKTREGDYFNYVQPEIHHRNTPKDGINSYSFALYPEEHQPSGTANLSRIQTTTLTLKFDDRTLTDNLQDINFYNEDNEFYIFGLSYNILRFMSGFAGLAYITT